MRVPAGASRTSSSGTGAIAPLPFIEVETVDERGLNKLVIDRIQRLDGVERTETHIVVT